MSNGNVTLKQLRAFAAVAREGSFTRAAEKLHVTQSTLTSSIKILEGEIGMKLFDRSTRAVLLTAQGSGFLPAAERMLRDLDESLAELRMTASRQRGSVVVAAAASFINYVMSPAVLDLARAYPGISVRMSEEATEGACRMVLSGEADFGVTTLFEPVTGLDTALILSDSYGAVYSPEYELRNAPNPLPWSKLAPYTMVGLHRSNGIRALIDIQQRIPQRYKKPAYEVGSMPSLYPLLARCLGYAALPALAAQPLVASGLLYTPLVQPVLRRQLYAVKRRGRALSPAALALLGCMTNALLGMQPNAHLKIVFGEAAMRVFWTGK